MALITVFTTPKPQPQAKPFPKLMINRHWGDQIIEFHEHPDQPGKYIAIHRTGKHAGEVCLDFNSDAMFSKFEDYNEPITLQNLSPYKTHNT